jgi:Fur family ferric uptake transcriptional regulator
MSIQRRDTKQKRAIWSIVEAAGRPLSPSEVHTQVVRCLPRVSLSTVYRSLKALQDERRVVAVSLPGEPDRYETKIIADHHHHHFYCDECGKVFDVPGCGLQIDRRLPKGFELTRHEVVLYGSCSECA